MFVRATAGLAAAVFLAGCAPSSAPSDADVDAAIETCHHDCAHSYVCIDGGVFEVSGVPVACSLWTGACPSTPIPCLRGCREGTRLLLAGRPLGEDAGGICIDNLLRRAGDPCLAPDGGDCVPAEPVPDGDGGTMIPFLACDPSTLRCVGVP